LKDSLNSYSHNVDGSEILHQLRLVVYPLFIRAYTSQVVTVAGFPPSTGIFGTQGITLKLFGSNFVLSSLDFGFAVPKRVNFAELEVLDIKGVQKTCWQWLSRLQASPSGKKSIQIKPPWFGCYIRFGVCTFLIV